MRTALRKFIKRLRGQIKQSDTLFALRRNFIDKDLRRERKRLKACTVKTPLKIKEEINIYKKFWGCIPHDYIRYALFDKDLPIDQIIDYIPMHYYYCNYYNDIFADVIKKASEEGFILNNFPETYKALKVLPKSIFNAIGHGRDLSDKLLQYFILHEVGIDVPEVVGIIYADRVYRLDGTEIDFFSAIKYAGNVNKIFVKPTDGCGGTGIKVIERVDDFAYTCEGRELKSVNDLGLSSSQVYIVQKALQQHESLSVINPTSVNTLRTIVRYQNGIPQIIGIILRMGRKNSHVDNSHVGGFSVGIDVHTGKFFEYGAPEHGGGTYDRHPDSNYVFAGNGIDNWDNILTNIKDIVSAITVFPIIGWDIAISSTGVQAIEFNMGFGIEHAQTILGGLRRALDINPNSSPRL